VKLFKKIIFNAKGMNFMEMIAGAAIFGVVSTVAVKNLSTSNKEMVSTKERLKIESATKSISDVLKRKSLCESAIQNLDVTKLSSGDGLILKKEQVNKDENNCVEPTRPQQSNQGETDGVSGGSRFQEQMAEYERSLAEYRECLERAQDSQVSLDEDNRKVIETGAGTLNLSRTSIDIGRELDSGIRLDAIGLKLGGSSGEVPLYFTIEFGVPIGNTGRFKTVKRVVEMQVQIRSGQIVCDSFQGSEIFDSATAKICDELGGVMVGATCDVSGGLDSELSDRLSLAACEALDASGAGVFSSGLCSRILLNGQIESQNISPNKLVINSDERNIFDNTDCAGYLGGYQRAGQKECKAIEFNFVGGTLPNCDLQDGYRLEGDNAANATSTCRDLDYSYDEGNDRCNFSEVGSDTAELCQVFATGSCSGSSPGVVETVPDGTVCGSGKACSGGNCIDAPVCDDTYSLSGTQSATGTSTCTQFDREVNFDFSGCNSSSSIQATAGECKRIRSGTCNNSIAGVVENYPDGTDCGSGKTCQAGVCSDGDDNDLDLQCAEGFFRDQTACIAANPDRACETLTVGWTQRNGTYELCSVLEDDRCNPLWCPARSVGTWVETSRISCGASGSLPAMRDFAGARCSSLGSTMRVKTRDGRCRTGNSETLMEAELTCQP
tara:strand:+ start:7965 stop:9962 length:1998 start_codon:yes stop_codon:yes gene_type:complete